MRKRKSRKMEGTSEWSEKQVERYFECVQMKEFSFLLLSLGFADYLCKLTVGKRSTNMCKKKAQKSEKP